MKITSLRFAGVCALLAALSPNGARADKIKHPTAVFSGLDKITGRIISFDVATDETVQFGSIQITPRVCYTRPPTEAPQTTGFVEVDEVQVDNKFKRIFSGWMFAASPGLHGVEHPVYDVWLTDCKGGTQIISDATAQTEENIINTPQPPKPGTVPRPRQTARPANGALPGTPPGGLPGAIQAGPLTAPNPLDGPPRPRGNVGAANPQPTQRRAPSQSFFPAPAVPGEGPRDRD